jgi:transcriptional regulator of arginine metabolism
MHYKCIIMSSTLRKSERQGAIRDLVRERHIATQSELRDALAERGFDVDQGTVSRDVKDLGIVKAAGEDGAYYYAVLDDVSPAVRTTRLSLLRQLVRSVLSSGNLVVVDCGPGNASAVGEAIDHLNFSEIIGTIAGDNTLLAVVREGTSARAVVGKIRKEIGAEQ